MSKRRIAFWMAVLWGGLFLLAEIGLRVIVGLGTPPLLQADSTIGYVFQPNQELRRFGNRVRINPFHQRSERPSNRPDSSVLRVLFLGDSVTWGGVLIDQPSTYPEVFEAAANAACETPVEALNASAGSWGLGNLQAYLERFGTFESDVVVLQIGSHDLLQATSDSSPVGIHPAFPTENPILATQELVTRYLWPRYVRPLVASPVSDSAPRDSSAKAAQFKQNMKVLEDMFEAIHAAGAQSIVLHTPDRREVIAGSDGAYAALYAAYRPRFLALVDSLNGRVINLPERWKGNVASMGYFRDGVHLSTKGNRAVGELIKASSMIQCP